MSRAAHAFLEWWDFMALMYTRHGDARDIENKPEWPEFQRRQDALLGILHGETTAPEEILLASLQASIVELLGSTEPARISCRQAEDVVSLTKRTAVQHEAQVARATGQVN